MNVYVREMVSALAQAGVEVERQGWGVVVPRRAVERSLQLKT